MRTKAIYIMLAALVSVSLTGCPKNANQTADKPKSDSVDETTLFSQASKAELGQRYQEAADLYVEIANNYPNSQYRDKALFMAGYLKSENLNQKQEAIKYFKEMLEKYPESDLVDDAQFMINSIESGKDAISKFEEQAPN
jgi:outer membrane protein assembly factor BamD (BamD/ComL family)